MHSKRMTGQPEQKARQALDSLKALKNTKPTPQLFYWFL
jgi:hypothetical protein